MTRIALIPSSYPPALGGVEELTRHLALAQVAAGHVVEVWTTTPDDTGPPVTEELDGITVRRFPFPLPAANARALLRFPFGAAKTIGLLRRAVRSFEPDLLHVQCFGPNGVYATALARLTGVPLVVTLQGETVMDDADIFETSASLRTGLRWAMRTASVVTGCSTYTLADAEARFGLASGRGVAVPNGVDLAATPPSTAPTTAPTTTTWQGRPGRPFVFAVGRVVEKKGFDLLLRAYAAVPPEKRTLDLVVGGDGAAREGLVQLAEDLGVGAQVRFPGRLSREEVARAMAEAELFVMPSRLEPFGIVVLEAWRAGTAVVATRHGGPPELIADGVDGLLVDPFDTGELARVLEAAMGDPELRRSLGEAGRQRVAQFDWPVVARRYEQLYPDRAGRHDEERRPLSVHFSAAWPGNIEVAHDELRDAGIDVTLSHRTVDWHLGQLARAWAYLGDSVRTAWQARRYDVTVVSTAGIETFLVPLLWPLFVGHDHKLVILDPLPLRWRRLDRVFGYGLRTVSLVVCIRSGDRDTFATRYGVGPDRTRFVRMPAPALPDRDLSAEGDPTPVLLDGAPYAYAAGSAHRDSPLLLAAFERLPHRCVLATLDVGQLERSAPPNVTLLPHQSPADGRLLMRAATIVVAPFKDTDLACGPTIVLDALAMGIPVVATDVNACRDYLQDGTTGLLTPPGDPDALADAVDRLMRDPLTRAAMGAEALRTARTDLSRERFLDALSSLLLEVAGRQGGTAEPA
ncbi:MAG: glycosyltransferase family 4 protein [Acidimicrobiales bacterium]